MIKNYHYLYFILKIINLCKQKNVFCLLLLPIAGLKEFHFRREGMKECNHTSSFPSLAVEAKKDE